MTGRRTQGAGVGGSWSRRLLMLALLAGAGGCHTYVPVADPEPGTTVRVRVPVTSALVGPNAPQGSASIEGQVVALRDTLYLATTNRQEYGAYREVVMYDTLALAPDQLLSIERAEFSTGRTMVLTAAIVVAAGAFALAAFSGETGSKGGPPPPPPPQGALVISNSFVSGVLGMLGIAR